MSLATTLTQVVGVTGSAVSFAQGALPWVRLLAGLVPGAGSVLAAIEIAGPIIDRIATVAPIVDRFIQTGLPILDAMERSAPGMISDVKELYATLVNADPARPETDLEGDDIADAIAEGFWKNGRVMTQAEENQWFKNVQGDIGAI